MAGEEKAGWKVGFRNVAASQIVFKFYASLRDFGFYSE